MPRRERTPRRPRNAHLELEDEDEDIHDRRGRRCTPRCAFFYSVAACWIFAFLLSLVYLGIEVVGGGSVASLVLHSAALPPMMP